MRLFGCDLIECGFLVGLLANAFASRAGRAFFQSWTSVIPITPRPRRLVWIADDLWLRFIEGIGVNRIERVSFKYIENVRYFQQRA